MGLPSRAAWVFALTPEEAAFVRHLRVDEGYTFRAVAVACYQAWGADAPARGWLLAGKWEDQHTGIILCELAAAHFGEDINKGDWFDSPKWRTLPPPPPPHPYYAERGRKPPRT